MPEIAIPMLLLDHIEPTEPANSLLGGLEPLLVTPQGARHIRSRAGHARSLTGHCAWARIRLPQISQAARSEEQP